MQLTHDFTVPATVEQTWDAFNDIEGMAGCFPGATVTAVEGDSFEGSVKVKLGPIALVYNGAGSFTEKDQAASRLVIAAKGKDKRGNGTAGADVVTTMTAVDAASTRVTVVTELSITGKPAQFGRGVMQDVSDKLLAQFADCLAKRLTAPAEPVDAGAAPAGAETEPTPIGDSAADSAAAPRSASAPGPGPSAPRPAVPAQNDALDLGATVLPVLARTYWRQAVGVVVGLLVLRRLLRRRRC